MVVVKGGKSGGIISAQDLVKPGSGTGGVATDLDKWLGTITKVVGMAERFMPLLDRYIKPRGYTNSNKVEVIRDEVEVPVAVPTMPEISAEMVLKGIDMLMTQVGDVKISELREMVAKNPNGIEQLMKMVKEHLV